mmetsp:Transcript_62896/g.174321  ORF Transcript_62896/g.174321 Transcript_62896/m.174321 type:complete len:640 (+) Transcript_62896:71-1990(+)
MGSGASAAIKASVQVAKPEELQVLLEGFDPEGRARLEAALAGLTGQAAAGPGLVQLLGPKLLSKDGEVDTAKALAGKIVGLYFSAHWCPPCRGFTPQLAELYTASLQAKGLEVVLASRDRDEEAFKEYYASMPWLALPWPAGGGLYGSTFVQGGMVGLMSMHFESADNCYMSYNFGSFGNLDDGSALPDKKPFTDIAFDEATRTFCGKVAWDAPATFHGVARSEFRMVFDENYNNIVEGEVKEWAVDGTEGSPVLFGENGRLRYTRLSGTAALSAKFDVRGIPTLVLLESDGSIITKKGRAKVLEDPEGFPWRPDPDLKSKCGQIFDIFDEDKDGFLNHKELSQLQLEMGVSGLPAEIFPLICADLGCDPKQGVTKAALFRVYTDMGMGDIGRDFQRVSNPAKRKRAQVLAAAKEGSRLTAEQLDKLFSKYDPDKDLTKEEFIELWKELGFQEEFVETYFGAVDTNKNGVISFKELLGGLTVCSAHDSDKTAEFLVQVYDTKKTGFLDKEEFCAAMESSLKVIQAAAMTAVMPMIEMLNTMEEAAAVMAEAAGEGEAPPSGPSKEEMVKELLAEMPLPKVEELMEAFSQIDANQDGKLTLEELKKTLKENPEVAAILLPNLAAKEMTEQVSGAGACSIM